MMKSQFSDNFHIPNSEKTSLLLSGDSLTSLMYCQARRSPGVVNIELQLRVDSPAEIPSLRLKAYFYFLVHSILAGRFLIIISMLPYFIPGFVRAGGAGSFCRFTG